MSKRDVRPWMRFDPVSFFAMDAVAAMDSEAVGLYLWLCGEQWQLGSIPLAEATVKGMCRGRFRNWKATWSQLRAGFDEKDGRLVAAWVEVERERADTFSKIQSDKGKLRQAAAASRGSAVAQPKSAGAEPSPAEPQQRSANPQPLNGTGRNETEEKNQTATAPPIAAALKKPRTVPAGDHPQLMDHWWQEWQRTRGTPYAFQTKHATAAKRILALSGSTLQEARTRVTKLLEHSDPWMAENASLCLVESRWNELGVGPRPTQRAESPLRRAAFEELRQPRAVANGKH